MYLDRLSHKTLNLTVALRYSRVSGGLGVKKKTRLRVLRKQNTLERVYKTKIYRFEVVPPGNRVSCNFLGKIDPLEMGRSFRKLHKPSRGITYARLGKFFRGEREPRSGSSRGLFLSRPFDIPRYFRESEISCKTLIANDTRPLCSQHFGRIEEEEEKERREKRKEKGEKKKERYKRSVPRVESALHRPVVYSVTGFRVHRSKGTRLPEVSTKISELSPRKKFLP